MPALRVIGPGSAGMSLAVALQGAGWRVEAPRRRGDPLANAAAGVDLLVIATPDHAVAEVAAAVLPVATTVVAHLAGSLGLDALLPHPRRAVVHPIVPLCDPARGAARLVGGAWFAVSGDALAGDVVDALGGRTVAIDDADRAAHHAAASIASNHLVALLGQVERVARPAGVPLEAYMGLARAALDDAATEGPAAALTGPVARGDWATVQRHLAAIDPSERVVYRALAAAAARLRRPRSPSTGGPGSTAGGGAGVPPLGGGRGWGPAGGGEAAGSAVLFETVSGLRATLDPARAAGLTVGLVATMGALHEGHLSLVRRSAAECDVSVVTVFVNPLQFGPGEDLATYPRDRASDLDRAAAGGADAVFAPAVTEMYPEPPATTVVVGGLADVLEGESRPGHFNGVATVVSKLFNVVGPCRAYFGEKDWQQLLVVRRLVRDLSFPVEVVACPTVRDPDGLACSSRNARLSPDERLAATALHRALAESSTLVEAGERDPATVRRRLVEVAAAAPGATVDYAEVRRAGDLALLDRLEGDVRLLVAARFGPTRLIDNLGVSVPAASRRAPGAAAADRRVAATPRSS